MRDDDMQTQISLVEKSVDRGMAGIIVSPIQTLPMRTPIRRVLTRGVPVVVIDTEYHGQMTMAKVDKIIGKLKEGAQ